MSIESSLKSIAESLKTIAENLRNVEIGVTPQVPGIQEQEQPAQTEQVNLEPSTVEPSPTDQQQVAQSQEQWVQPSKESLDAMRAYLMPIARDKHYGKTALQSMLNRLGVKELSQLSETRFGELEALAKPCLDEMSRRTMS